MAKFPILKTNALAQYPISRRVERPVRDLRFMDGSARRFALRKPSRSWRLSLSRLDESELDRLRRFFELHRADGTRFEFEDPKTGEIASNCRFGQFELKLEIDRDGLGETTIVIVEELN